MKGNRFRRGLGGSTGSSFSCNGCELCPQCFALAGIDEVADGFISNDEARIQCDALLAEIGAIIWPDFVEAA